MRLYKTKEKLAKPILKNEEGRSKNEESAAEIQKAEKPLNEEERSKNEESVTEIQKSENPLNEEEKKKEEGSADEKNNDSSFFIHNSSLEENSSLDQLPPYLEILKNVMERSDGSEDGTLIFTFDEMCFLAEDPGFREVYPQSAEKFRNMLAQFAVESGEDSS